MAESLAIGIEMSGESVRRGNSIVYQHSTAGWLRAFLKRRELDAPDGRPLFEYRITADEYAVLREYFRNRLPKVTHDAAAFCLCAAEWWRQEGTSFRWDGLLEALEIRVGYKDLYDPVARGMAFWERELRLVRTGSDASRQWRDFVGTLAREGGLPLQMLFRARADVHRFIRGLLLECSASGEISAERAELAGHMLPDAWRHPDIYELAARLATRVWELRESVKDAEQPVVALEHRRPGWQNALPMLVDNDAAATLVHGLVVDAHEIAGARRPVLTVDTRLVRREDRWIIERCIDPPRRIRPERLPSLLGIERDAPLPNRLRLILDDDGERRLLALVTQWRAEEPYDVEWLVSAPLRLRTTGALVLLAEAPDQLLGGHVIYGGDALEAAPWLFVEDGNGSADQEWRLVARGSARLRAKEALVALPPDWSITASPATNIAHHAELRTSTGARTLIKVTGGTISLRGPDAADLYRIEVDAAEDDLWSYELDGETLGDDTRNAVWRGIPRVLAESPTGPRRVIGRAELQWRPFGVGSPWYPLSDDCVGKAELRYTKDGATRFRKTIKVAPPTTHVELTPRAAADAGGFRLTGTRAERAEVVGGPGFRTTRADSAGGYEWTVETVSDPPATLDVELSWSGARSLRLRVPYPVTGVRFIDRAGRVLPAGGTVALEHLPGSRVEAIVPQSEPAPTLRARLEKASDCSRGFTEDSQAWYTLRSQDPRARSVLRRYSLDLLVIDEAVRLRLASSTDLNACVSLSMGSHHAGSCEVHVRRFPVALRVDRDADAVVVLPDKSETFVDPMLATMELVRFPVVNPAAERLPFPRGTMTSWSLGDLKESPETWVVAGFRGGRCCARPIIFAPSSMDLGAPPVEPIRAYTIDAAVRIPWTKQRIVSLEDLLVRMLRDPGHPEWPHLDPYVVTLGELPATTFDLLDAMALVPGSCVYALLAGQRRLSFHALWSAFEDLSFAWELVSISDWIRGIRAWWESSLRALEGCDEATRAWATESFLTRYRDTTEHVRMRMPAFSVIHELLERRVFARNEESNQSVIRMLTFPGGGGRKPLLDDRNQALQVLRRRHADDRWPMNDTLRVVHEHIMSKLPRKLLALDGFDPRMTLHPEHRSVALAPVLAALAAACGVSLRPEQIFAIRQLKSFDLEWFQRCYDLTLANAVGMLLEEDPEHYQ